MKEITIKVPYNFNIPDGYEIKLVKKVNKLIDEDIGISYLNYEKINKSMYTMYQINNLMPYYGGIISDKEWEDENIVKYVIKRYKNTIVSCENWLDNYSFLAFHTPEQRSKFFKKHIQLIKDYLMIN